MVGLLVHWFFTPTIGSPEQNVSEFEPRSQDVTTRSFRPSLQL